MVWPEPRPLEDYQEFIYGQLAALNSPLTDRSPGSGLYTLTRALAATHAEQDLRLQEAYYACSPATAYGEALDRHAADYGLKRKPGTPARGWVLAKALAETTQLPPQLVLTEPHSTLQFWVQSPQPVTLSFILETRLAVVCTQVGEVGNLKAGTRLFHPDYPQVQFVVGGQRTTTGVVGDLQGGSDPEDDSALRSRLYDRLTHASQSTGPALLQTLLAQVDVLWADVTVPTPGVAAFWVDAAAPLSHSRLNELLASIEPQRPAGIVYTLSQVGQQLLDMELRIWPAPGIDLDELSSSLRQLVRDYVRSLSLHKTLSRQTLKAVLKQQVPGLLELEVAVPETDLQPAPYHVFRLRHVALTYV